MSTPNEPPWPQQQPRLPGPGGPPEGQSPYGQPSYGQPQGQPSPYGQPDGQPSPYGQPPYGQPQGQPSYGQPQSQPPYGQPPGYTPPSYGGQPYPEDYPTAQLPGGYASQPGPGGYPPQLGQMGAGPRGAGPGGQPPARKGSGRVVLIVGAIVLALIVLGVGTAVLINRTTQTTTDPTDPTGTGGPGGSAPPNSTAPPAATTGDAAVKAYLEALAAGQATVALALAKDQPADTTFLTDAVLANSIKRAPITDITVSPPDSEYDSSIEASYKMGDQQVNETFTVEKRGETFLLYEVSQGVNLETIRSRTLPMKINGVEVTSDTVELFPGSYAFSSGNSYVAYGSGAMLIKSPNDFASAYDYRPKITEAGTKAAVRAARAKLAACVKEAKFKPSGCAFLNIRESPGQNITESTLRRKILGNPFSNVKPRLDFQDPAIAEFSMSVRWSATASGTQSGRRASFEISSAVDFTTARARLTNDPLKVTFDR